MARPLEVDWQDDAQTLRRHYLQSKDHQDRQRMQLLWLVRRGESLKDAALAVGASYRATQNWIGWYRFGGVEEVLSHRCGGSHGGRSSDLSKKQEEALLEKARKGQVRTIFDGVEWARSEADVEYTYWGMRHVFERLDLKKKVPRPQAPKANSEEQEAWKKGA